LLVLLFFILFGFFIFSARFYLLGNNHLLAKINAMKRYLYLFLLFCLICFFTISLCYLLLLTKTGSYYFIAHFLVVVPIASLSLDRVLSSLLIRKRWNNFSGIAIFLYFFSVLMAFIYMGLSSYMGE